MGGMVYRVLASSVDGLKTVDGGVEIDFTNVASDGNTLCQ